MANQQKILLTGTHLTPALELINQLREDTDTSWQIYYIGRKFNSSVSTTPSIESQLIPQMNVNFFGINCGKFDRRWLPNTISGLPQIISGFLSSLRLIFQIRPSVIVSFGGYVSVPVVLASWLCRIPIITHEQTPTLSLSTKINSFFSRYIALSFPSTYENKKYILTGNLLRREIFSTTSNLFEKLNIDYKKYPIIFVTAGNQGSLFINHQIEKILPHLSKKFTVIHQTGHSQISRFKKLNHPHYNAFSYINSTDIGWVLNNARLIISRAGANTTQEILALNQSSILIPLPVSQQNEQDKNALYVQQKLPTQTIIIPQTNLTSKLLLSSIEKLSTIKKVSTPTTKINYKLLKLIKTI